MEKFKIRINTLFGKIGKSLFKGFIIVIPIIITIWIIKKGKSLVESYSINFIPYISDAAAIFVTLFLIWTLGAISSFIFFGRNINQWLDYVCCNLPVIGPIYAFFNKIAEIGEKKDGNENKKTGKPVIMPFFNNMMQQIGYITNKEKVLLYHENYKKKVWHYVVNFPPAANLMGGSVVFIPEELLIEHEENFTLNEAIQFNLSAGGILPVRFTQET